MATNRSPVMPSSPAEAEGRTHFTPEEARVLVDQCFVEFKTRLTEATRTSLELAVDLFESHSHIPDGEVEQFRTKRGEWLERFAKTIDDLYAKRMAGHQRKGRRPDPDASAATLKVLSAFDHDKQQALTAGTSLLRRFTQREMDALDLRLEILMPVAPSREFDNPFAPDYVLDAIGATSRAVYPSPRIWRPLMERMLTDLTSGINKIYIALNRMLADKNVLPEIKAALRVRSRHRPEDDRDLLPAFSRMLAETGDEVLPEVVVPDAFSPPDAPPALQFNEWSSARGAPTGVAPAVRAPLPTGSTQVASAVAPPAAAPALTTAPTPVPSAGATVVPQTLPTPAILAGLAALAKLGAATAAAAPAAAQPLPAAPSAPFVPRPADEFPDLDPMLALGAQTPLFNTLAVWQRLDLPRAIATAAPMPAGAVAGDAALVPLNLIPHIRTAVADQLSSPTDRITMDVIALLFDYIFRDPSIPEELRNLFGRLQVPILKAALLDRTFFSDRKHPARRLLDHLADAAIGATSVPEYRDAFADFATTVVDEVCRDFEIDVTVFDGADRKLQRFMEAERHRTDAALDPDVASALADERSHIDRAEVRARIRDRLAGLTLPFAVRAFAESTWTDYLTSLRKTHGAESTEVKLALQTMDDMLWSIVVKERTAQKARLTKMIPSLVMSLKRGSETMQVPAERAKAFFDELYNLHIAAIKPKPEVVAAADGAPPEAAAAADAKATVPPANVHDYVSEMVPGTWMRFTNADGGTSNARLSWISPLRTKYIFTSRSRARAFIYAPEELAWELGAGRATLLVEPVPLFDRAVSAALDSLAASKPAAPASATVH